MSETSRLRRLGLLLMCVGASCVGFALYTQLTSISSATADAVGNQPSDQSSHLDTVRRRGYLICGITGNKPGFSMMESTAYLDDSELMPEDRGRQLYEQASGLEVDYCRAIATGLFGQREAVVYYRNMDQGSEANFAALRNHEIDVLFRGLVYNRSIPLENRVEFTPIIYFEPAALLFDTERFATLSALPAQAKICAIVSTQALYETERYIRNSASNWQLQPLQPRENLDVRSLLASQCDALANRYTTSRIYIQFQNLENKYQVTTLGKNYAISIAGAIVENDARWRNLVQHAIWTPMKAAVDGVRSDSEQITTNRWIWGLMGLDPESGPDIIRVIGNFDEMYLRNLAAYLPESGANQHYRSSIDGRLIPPY